VDCIDEEDPAVSLQSELAGRRAEALRGLCGGAVYLPGDRGYDLARLPWNLQVQDHPAAVTYPAGPAEVAEVLRAARDAGLHVAPQGTGHGAAPLEGRLADAVLLRTSGMTELHVDPVRRTARAGAGVLWGDVADAAGVLGLAGLHPSSPDVGVVGYSLGGGIGWYARRYGLQCNAVTAAEIVLADGTFVRATADHDAELFWALRGGGAPLGVVTALEFDLLPLDTVVAGYFVWDWSDVERVLPAWVRWTKECPEDATTSFRLVVTGNEPSIPPELHGRRLVVIDGAVLGDDDAAARMLQPLRDIAPEVDTFGRVPAPSLVRLHLEPEGPTPGYAKSMLLSDLPGAATDAFLTAAGPASGTSLTVSELRHLGGALGRSAPGAGALTSLEGEYLVLGLGLEADPASWPQLREDAERLVAALEPWATGRQYLPMIDESADTRKAFPPGVLARLSAVRAAADPDRLFVAQHLVPPQGA
jgi:FAD/FMN-containing dehydrogenase